MAVISASLIAAAIAAGAGAGTANQLVRNPSLTDGKNTPTDRDLRELEGFIKRKGRLPNDEELKDLSAWWQVASRRRVEEWYGEMAEQGQKMLEENPDYVQKKMEESGFDQTFWDEANVREEGTKENDLYSFYRNMGEQQHKSSQAELARSERDTQVEMAQQRQQMMDEVRKRRQNQLRSGLSSAQIANEEIQTLFMGQQAQQQSAQNYYTQRAQVNQQQQMNPYEAELQARQHIQGGQQGNSAMYAAYTGDPIQTGKDYDRLGSKVRQNVDFFLGTDEEK